MLLNWFYCCHQFAIRYGLYPVMLSSTLAVLLFGGRAFLTKSWIYHFLLWNLFLAWVPYLMSLGTVYIYRQQPRHRWSLFVPASIWLIFFPNAPYIVTDFSHLQARPPAPLWYDIGLLSTFAWSGLFLAIFSLRLMQLLVRKMAGFLISWLFVASVVGLSGVGIYMGRFLRWNSWDLLFHPRAVVYDIIVRFSNPFDHSAALGVSILFSTFLLVCYLTFTVGTLPERNDEPLQPSV